MNAKEQAERLMNSLLPLAEKMLSEHGDFFPYGGYLKPDGKIVEIGAADSRTDHPKSMDLILVLEESLRQKARGRQCIAAAIVFNVEVPLSDVHESSAAIQVNVEHKEGYSAEVFLPYRLENRMVEFGHTFAQLGEHRISVGL